MPSSVHAGFDNKLEWKRPCCKNMRVIIFGDSNLKHYCSLDHPLDWSVNSFCGMDLVECGLLIRNGSFAGLDLIDPELPIYRENKKLADEDRNKMFLDTFIHERKLGIWNADSPNEFAPQLLANNLRTKEDAEPRVGEALREQINRKGRPFSNFGEYKCSHCGENCCKKFRGIIVINCGTNTILKRGHKSTNYDNLTLFITKSINKMYPAKKKMFFTSPCYSPAMEALYRPDEFDAMIDSFASTGNFLQTADISLPFKLAYTEDKVHLKKESCIYYFTALFQNL